MRPSILSLLVLLLATSGLALSAAAQSITPPDWELALEAHNRDVTVYVFDLDGFLVHTASVAGDGDAQLDWFLSTDGQTCCGIPDVGRQQVYVQFVTAGPGGATTTYLWGYQEGPNDPPSFYDPFWFGGLPYATTFEVDGAAVEAYYPTPPGTYTGTLNDLFPDDEWVMPYDRDKACDLAGCTASSYEAETFLTLVPPISVPSPCQVGTCQVTVPAPTYTFAGTVTIPTGQEPLWTVPGLTLQFRLGQTLTVEGFLLTDDTSLVPESISLGWRGVQFEPGSSGVLGPGTLVEWTTTTGGISSALGINVSVHDATVTLDGAELRNAFTGLSAYGTAADVTVTGESQIYNLAGWGVYAELGAEVTITGDSEIFFNVLGGVRAGDQGTTIHLDGAVVRENDGVGVRSQDGAEVHFAEYEPGAQPVEVRDNYGGLDASAALINAGTCEQTTAPCPDRPVHEIVNNELASRPDDFDARSLSGSVLFAQGNFWGFDVDDPSDLVLIEDRSSLLVVTPIATSPGLRTGDDTAGDGTRATSGVVPRGAAAPRGEGSAVLTLVDAAERAYLAGGEAEAFAFLAEATLAAAVIGASEDDRRAAFEAAERLFAWRQPAEALLGLAALAQVPGPAQPWALRALTVAYASAGRVADAQAAAEALAASYAESEHALFGLGYAVRIEIEEGDEAGALRALEALVAAFPEAELTARRAVQVAAVFPGVNVTGVLAQGRRPSSGTSASADAVAAGDLLHLGAARPNPAASEAIVPFELMAEAAVEAVLYDGLGRRVALLAQGRYGAGSHALTLEGAALPAGLYVVHVTARTAGGVATAVERLTLTR